jgi:signal transduction histidine kinase
VLSIKDNGPGIAERDRSRIFDPFFTTKQASLGLGLTIARRVVAGLGGTLTAHGEPGSGAEFQLRIPRGLALEATE